MLYWDPAVSFYSQWYEPVMQRKMTDPELWWCIVSTSSHDRCLNGGNSLIANRRKAVVSAGNYIYIMMDPYPIEIICYGSLSHWDNLLLTILLVYFYVKPLYRHRNYGIILGSVFEKDSINSAATAHCLQIVIIKSSQCDLTYFSDIISCKAFFAVSVHVITEFK